MSFLTGKQETITSVPSDVTGLRKGLASFLQNQGPEGAITGLGRGENLDMFTKLFQDTLSPVLAQAKESAGNLTGSSLGNVIGTAAGRSTSDFLLNLLNQRASRFASLLGGLSTTGVSATPAYKPGFLDYLFQGAKAAAPFVAAAA